MSLLSAYTNNQHYMWLNIAVLQSHSFYITAAAALDNVGLSWQDLHDDDKTCMQLSYWELILENGQ
jgi:hypothetical protein